MEDFDSINSKVQSAQADSSLVTGQQQNAFGAAKGGIAAGDDFNTQLSNLNLASMMGGPLKAAIVGMTQAAQNSVKFIKTVCFAKGSGGTMGDPIMIQFKVQKPGGTLGSVNNYATVTIPFMTMVHIPFLRLDKVIVDFSVKLTSSRTQNLSASQAKVGIKVDSATKSGSSFSGTYTQDKQESGDDKEETVGAVPSYSPLAGESKEWNSTASFTGLTSTREDSKTGNEIRKDYSLSVVITAVQDALPVGIEKMLDILEAEIKDTSGDALSSQLTGKLLSSIQGPIGSTGTAAAAPPAF